MDDSELLPSSDQPQEDNSMEHIASATTTTLANTEDVKNFDQMIAVHEWNIVSNLLKKNNLKVRNEDEFK